MTDDNQAAAASTAAATACMTARNTVSAAQSALGPIAASLGLTQHLDVQATAAVDGTARSDISSTSVDRRYSIAMDGFAACCARCLAALEGLANGWCAGDGRPCASLVARLQQAGRARRWGDTIETAGILKEVAWQKLHTGHWKDVPVEWRDAYSLFSVLHTAAGLLLFYMDAGVAHDSAEAPLALRAPPIVAGAAGAAVAPLVEAGVQQHAMRQLDLAAMMGGMRFRHLLDSCMDLLEQLAGPSQPQDHPQVQQAQGVEGHSKQQSADQPTAGSCHLKRQPPACNPVPAKRACPQPSTAPCTDGAAARPTASPAADPGAAAATSPAEGSPAGPVLASRGPSRLPADLPAQARALLPPGSLVPPIQRLQVLQAPSLERFLLDVLLAPGGAMPVVVTGAMAAWPALTRWQDLGYLQRVAGHRTVPVEVGRTYLEEGWGTQLMTLGQYITDCVLAGQGSERHVSTGSGISSGRVAYLAQHQLFEQIPALQKDICVPDYVALGENGLDSVHAWFGPAATVTPLHQDPKHNFLAQVVGIKYVRLYSPEHTQQLYPHSSGVHTNTSRVDVEAVDGAQFREFHQVPCWDVVLAPGDMLFMPAGWWHFVKALSVSFSVSFWWR